VCGRLNVTDDPFLQGLMSRLGMNGVLPPRADDVAPGGAMSIVHDAGADRMLSKAVWWLLLDSTSLKPDYRYTSFNSRSDQLSRPGSLSYQPYRSHRCVIPASGFVEGLGDKKHYFHIRPVEGAIAFGGIFKEWRSTETGEHVYSASIITLPPHEKLRPFHPKSMPLMLPQSSADLNRWLDSECIDPAEFDDWLEPTLRMDLVVTPIDRASRRNPVSESVYVHHDAA